MKSCKRKTGVLSRLPIARNMPHFPDIHRKKQHQHTLQFFAVTNFAVWAIGGFYPKTTAGLVNCVMAGVLFGGSAFAERMLPATRLQSIGTNCELIAGSQSRQSADAIIARP